MTALSATSQPGRESNLNSGLPIKYSEEDTLPFESCKVNRTSAWEANALQIIETEILKWVGESVVPTTSISEFQAKAQRANMMEYPSRPHSTKFPLTYSHPGNVCLVF